jgi:small-conductance mechanosensitive channel
MFLPADIAQGGATLADVVRDWHRDTLAFVENDLPKLLVFLLIAFVLSRIVMFFVNRMRHLADASELRTVASILRATAYSIIGFLLLLQILTALGIKVTPLLASAGVVGVGIGLGAQSLFKDIINGIFILVENQFNVGDTVKLASLTGTVVNLTLRATTLRGGDGTLSFITNSQIATV